MRLDFVDSHERTTFRVGQRPASSAEHPLLTLQRTAGNRAVTALVSVQGAPVVQLAPDGPGGSDDLVGNRKAAFGSRATGLGLVSEQIDRLWSVGGGPAAGPTVPAEEHTAALLHAARSTARGAPVIYIEFKVEGLADLNAKLGNNGANVRLDNAREAIERALVDLGGAEVTPMQRRAATFGFLVSGEPAQVNEPALGAHVQSIAAKIGEELGSPLSAAVMDSDGAAASAVIGEQVRDASANKARQRSVPGQLEASARFTSSGSDRKAAFTSMAEGFGMKPSSIDELYGTIVQSRPDLLTGFERAGDRLATVSKAADHVAKTGGAAIYVEVDVRNLGGLNRFLGREKADGVFATIAATAETEMASVSDLCDAWPFRHGGDEFSFVAVARRPGVDAAQLEFAVGAALTRANDSVKQATSEIADVPHTKPNGPPGTGIIWGTSVIRAGSRPGDVFSSADALVERKKKSSSRRSS